MIVRGRCTLHNQPLVLVKDTHPEESEAVVQTAATTPAYHEFNVELNLMCQTGEVECIGRWSVVAKMLRLSDAWTTVEGDHWS